MEFSLILKASLLVFLFSLQKQDVVLSAPLDGNFLKESFAVNALRDSFNDPFLNGNWSGIQCQIGQSVPWFGIECLNGRITAILLENMLLKGLVSDDAFFNFTELIQLSLRNNSISGEVMNFTYNPKLQKIDLSYNKLSGPISASLLSLNSLESLQLQNNNLTGTIPPFYQPRLVEFNVSGNRLDGEIPRTPVLQSLNSDSYSNNPELCGPPSDNPCKASDIGKKNSCEILSDFAFMFLLFDIVGLIAVVIVLIVYYKKYKKLNSMMSEKNVKELEEIELATEDEAGEEHDMAASGEQIIVAGACDKKNLTFTDDEESFELDDLLKASAEGLGMGIFGNTYKAMMKGKPVVVVKRLRDLKPMSDEEFAKQLGVIAAQKHPNLLSLLAYYCSKEEKLMIYKYAEKGNLFNRVHASKGSDQRIRFKWTARLSVARGVARALDHLHLTATSQNDAPHGNLKSSNVLLDENERVLVSDYGLNSLIALPIAAQRMVCYRSPEYQAAKKVSKKSDIWSYGCLILELLTGKVSAYSAPSGVSGDDLCSWVHRAVREEWTAEIFDSEITMNGNAAPGMLKLLQIAIRCCDVSPDKRPEIREVVREVENIKHVESEDEDDFSLDQSDDWSTSASASASASGTGTVGGEQ
ncbi:probable inactive receptor kinase At2g26730 [Tripterygium wilfordii]|uniref:probable inactive receptor kinase At2g26730 n=1 Tax=Tripterygium wilfordii TaxID=458696 RepID=UPI0018F821D7|nr:probable inactive receptor kinase At2g26730 [Tripterygium wilfordii]